VLQISLIARFCQEYPTQTAEESFRDVHSSSLRFPCDNVVYVTLRGMKKCADVGCPVPLVKLHLGLWREKGGYRSPSLSSELRKQSLLLSAIVKDVYGSCYQHSMNYRYHSLAPTPLACPLPPPGQLLPMAVDIDQQSWLPAMRNKVGLQ
jgi:hypothetical protein